MSLSADATALATALANEAPPRQMAPAVLDRDTRVGSLVTRIEGVIPDDPGVSLYDDVAAPREVKLYLPGAAEVEMVKNLIDAKKDFASRKDVLASVIKKEKGRKKVTCMA